MSNEQPISPARARRLAYVLAIVAAVLAAGAAADWDAPEFGRHPDEAGHFITGTLVHDWAVGGFEDAPLAYGLRYYASFPKVAFGHWPPVFYVVQAAWYGLFGVSRGAATALTWAVAGGVLASLFACSRRRVSWPAAIAATALVAASPVFRYCGSVFMADLLVVMISLGALACFARFLDSGKLGWSLGFGILAATAILTKQDAIVLGVVPPLAVALTRRWSLLKDWRFYAPAAVVLAVCAPYHVLMAHHTGSAWAGLRGPSLRDKAAFLAAGFGLGGRPGAALAVIGAAIGLGAAIRAGRASSLGAVLVAHAVGVVVVQMASPVSLDRRYLAALLPLGAYLTALAVDRMATRDRAPSRSRTAAVVALVGVIMGGQLAVPAGRKVSGYRALVGQFGESDDLQVVLVCSDPMGDGAIVSEFRLQHPSGRFCVLRADKVLAHSTWMGRQYQLRFDDAAGVEGYLNRQPVHYVVLDDWGRASGGHHALLRALIEAHPERFPLAASMPIERRIAGRADRGTAKLYRVEASRDARPRSLDVAIPGLADGRPIRVTSEGL